jgi:hypothetical protein
MNNRIRRLLRLATAALLLGVAITPSMSPVTVGAEELPYVFTTVDIPAAALSNVWGMNAAGEAVGFYKDTVTGPAHGFALSGGVYTKIDFPGNNIYATTLVGIGPSGEIVGDYLITNETTWGAWHSFRLTTKGEFIQADDPLHLSTIPMRVLPDGTIIGFVRDSADIGSKHGMVMSRNGITYHELPNSQHNGATPNGKVIVGHYVTANATGGWGAGAVTHGYILDNGGFTPFDVPGSTLTMAYDVNPAGHAVVGTFVDSLGKWHGFVAERRGETVQDWRFTTIDIPESSGTRVWTTNAGGDLAGNYTNAAGKTHGFVASRTQR